MPATYDELIAFLGELGTERVAHTEGSFLEHLISVYRDMQAQGCDESLCRAGMFHSIYGTERFQKFALPIERREDVRRLIGERAERLAYLNCAMDRASFDLAVGQSAEPYSFADRLTKQPATLSAQDFDDLCRVQLYDWLEQVSRSRHWDYRRSAYQSMAARLGEKAQRAYDAVFAKEPVASA